MSELPHLDPSLLPQPLPIMQGSIRQEEEVDPKKFESEMKKIKTDADQKKQRKREQEENENSKKIIEDAQELIEKREDSLYAIQKPNIKSLLKNKKTDPSEGTDKTFSLPSLGQASLLFSQNDFSLNLAEPPAQWIEREKRAESFSLGELEIPLESPALDEACFSLDVESNIEKIFSKPITKEKAPVEETSIPLEKVLVPEKKEKSKDTPPHKIKKPTFETIDTPIPQPPPFVFSLPQADPVTPSHYHHFSSDFFALFERIVGVITIIQTKGGISKTTLNLTQPQFASSIFFGSQITIEECDSAPREFNIRFSGSEQAVGAFRAHKQQLETALTEGFEKGRFHFKVHQVSTDLSAD